MNLPDIEILNNKRAPINFIIFLVVFDVLLLSYFFVFKVNDTVGNNLLLTLSHDKPSSAYFVPPAKTDLNVELVGKVEKIPEGVRNSKAEYSLVDKNHTEIALITSKQHELGLFAGLTVNLAGKIIDQTVSGVDLVDVKTISLK